MALKRLIIEGYGQLELNQVAFPRDGRIEANAACGRVIQPFFAYIVGGHVMRNEATETRQYHAVVVAQKQLYMFSQILHRLQN